MKRNDKNQEQLEYSEIENTSIQNRLKTVTWSKDVIDKSMKFVAGSLSDEEIFKKIQQDGVTKLFIIRKLCDGEHEDLREVLESYAFRSQKVVSLSQLHGNDSKQIKEAIDKYVARILSIDNCAPFRKAATDINIQTLQFLEHYLPYNYSKYLIQRGKSEATNLEDSISLFILMIKGEYRRNNCNSSDVQEAFRIFLKVNRAITEAQIEGNKCRYISGELNSEVVAKIKVDFAISINKFDKENKISTDESTQKKSAGNIITSTLSMPLLSESPEASPKR